MIIDYCIAGSPKDISYIPDDSRDGDDLVSRILF